MENLDNKYHDLDQFFQDKLGGDVQIDDSWNVPPINVLDNALGTINLNKKKRGKRNLLFLLLLLSIGLTFLVIRNSVNLHRIQQKVNLISKEQSTLNSAEKETPKKEKKNESQKNKIAKEQQLNSIVTNQAKQTTTEVSSNQNEAEYEVDNRSTNKIKAINKKATTPRQNQLTETSHTQNHPTNIFNNQNRSIKNSNQDQQKKTPPKELRATNLETKTPPENIGLSFDLPIQPPQKIDIPKPIKGLHVIPEQLNLSSIPLLPIIASELENSNNLQLLSYQKHFLPTNIIDSYITKFWTVYAFSGVNFSKQRMTNLSPNSGFTLLEYDKSYVGLESGVGLQYQFSPKFNLNFSLGYSKINNESVYSAKTKYISDNETIHADGTITYESGYSVQTTALAHIDTFDFVVKDNNIELMDNHTLIKQGCQNLRTSLALEYNIVSKNKFTVKLGAGTGVNYLMKAAQHLNTNILNGNNSLFRSNNTLAATKDMNRLLLFGFSTASVNYQISPKINLGLHNEYSIDLISSRKIDHTNDSKTFSQGLRTFLTAGYRF